MLFRSKDAWVDGHLTREGCNIAKIKESAARDGETESIAAALLTVVTHGDVVVEGLQDRTRAFPEDLPPDSPAEASTGPPSRDGSSAPHTRKSPSRVPAEDPTYQVHYRIVFKEVCDTLSEKTSISDIFKALLDICEGK